MTARLTAVFLLCIAILTSGCVFRPSASASCNLEPPDLPRLLQAIRPLVEKGFGDSEIDAVQRLSTSTPVKNTGTKTFPISYRGTESTLRVELKKDDVDEIEIWFITEPELAKEIQAKMKDSAR